MLSSDEIDDIYGNYYTWYIILTGISVHKASKEFKKEIELQRKNWEEEKKQYEEVKKRERNREEEEYSYNQKLHRKRDLEAWEEEKRKHEKQKLEEETVRQNLLKELEELRKEVAAFPGQKDKEIKAAVAQALAQANKDGQIHQNFTKQDYDSKLKLAQIQISSLEKTVKSQEAQIHELKQQYESARKDMKDIAVSVVEAGKKESPPQPPKTTQ